MVLYLREVEVNILIKSGAPSSSAVGRKLVMTPERIFPGLCKSLVKFEA